MHVDINFFPSFFPCRLCASCCCFLCVSTPWILNEFALIRIHFSLQDQISYRPAPTERTPILARPQTARAHSTHGQPISLIDALYIPGVMEFSLCLFFTKLVSYTFMYWLPLYIQSSSEFSRFKNSSFDYHMHHISLQAHWDLHCLQISQRSSMWAASWAPLPLAMYQIWRGCRPLFAPLCCSLPRPLWVVETVCELSSTIFTLSMLFLAANVPTIWRIVGLN